MWIRTSVVSAGLRIESPSLIDQHQGIFWGPLAFGGEGPDLGLRSNEIVWQLVFAR